MLKEKIDEKTLNQTKNSKNKNKIYESINKNIIGWLWEIFYNKCIII